MYLLTCPLEFFDCCITLKCELSKAWPKERFHVIWKNSISTYNSMELRKLDEVNRWMCRWALIKLNVNLGWPCVSLLRDSLILFIPNLQVIQSPKCFHFTVLIFLFENSHLSHTEEIDLKNNIIITAKELHDYDSLQYVCGNITVMRNDCLYTFLNLSSCSFQLSSHEIELQLLLFAKNQQSPKPPIKNNTHQSTKYHC